MKPRVLLAWSSGKDSAWALHVLRHDASLEVVGLLTTFNEAVDRVSMHAVRRMLVEQQARAVGLPLWPVRLPFPCSNADYEDRMRTAIAQAREAGVTHIAFGDLFLEDVREYRTRMLAGTGVEPLFPLWCSPSATPRLARKMVRSGMRAVITCVDPHQLPECFLGREFDEKFVSELPPTIDPCGERGEFHTFCYAGPMFREPIEVCAGERVHRDGFWFMDVVPVGSRWKPGNCD